jgi:hypothetical protein
VHCDPLLPPYNLKLALSQALKLRSRAEASAFGISHFDPKLSGLISSRQSREYSLTGNDQWEWSRMPLWLSCTFLK